MCRCRDDLAEVCMQPDLLQPNGRFFGADLPPAPISRPTGLDEEPAAGVIERGDPTDRPAKAIRAQRVDRSIQQPRAVSPSLRRWVHFQLTNLSVSRLVEIRVLAGHRGRKSDDALVLDRNEDAEAGLR